MINKLYKGTYEVICDNCGEGFECDTWEGVLESMRLEGWRKKLIDSTWVHFCSECAEEGER